MHPDRVIDKISVMAMQSAGDVYCSAILSATRKSLCLLTIPNESLCKKCFQTQQECSDEGFSCKPAREDGGLAAGIQ